MFARIDSKFLLVGAEVRCTWQDDLGGRVFLAFEGSSNEFFLTSPTRTEINDIIPYRSEATKLGTFWEEDTSKPGEDHQKVLKIVGWKTIYNHYTRTGCVSTDSNKVPYLTPTSTSPIAYIATNVCGKSAIAIPAYIDHGYGLVVCTNEYMKCIKFRGGCITGLRPASICFLSDTVVLNLNDIGLDYPVELIELNLANILSVESREEDEGNVVVKKDYGWFLNIRDAKTSNKFVRPYREQNTMGLEGIEHYIHASYDGHLNSLIRSPMETHLSRDVAGEVLGLLSRDLRDLFW